MSVCCECCMLSGRGVCDGLVTRPEESYRKWCVSNVCDHETSTKRGDPGPYRAVEPYKKKCLSQIFSDLCVVVLFYILPDVISGVTKVVGALAYWGLSGWEGRTGSAANVDKS
jgi:hypothetical protein